jgi:hypothetical protein
MGRVGAMTRTEVIACGRTSAVHEECWFGFAKVTRQQYFIKGMVVFKNLITMGKFPAPWGGILGG